MRLHIVRHGDALAKEADSSRPLSQQGRADVQAVAALLANAGLFGIPLLHSTKLRARQTAEILADAVGGEPREEAGLGPNDSITPWLDRLAAAREDLALVGHQPFVGRLATRLLTGREVPAAVVFEAGAALCLERLEDGWAVRWLVGPPLLPGG